MAATTLYEISHVSRYSYASPMRGCVMSLCLTPRDEPRQRLWSFELSTAPPSSMNPETDSFGNTKHVLNIHREHEALEIAALSTVETSGADPTVRPAGGRRVGGGPLVEGLVRILGLHSPKRARTRPSAALWTTSWPGQNLRAEGDPLEALTALSDALHSGFEYVPGSTSVVSPIDHILETGRGVCQDYAHVMIAVARFWGVPARYVSGYVPLESGSTALTSASHAWVECLLPGLGWTGFDPTNGRLPGESHVRVAVGRDYQDVAPTQGVLLGGGDSTLEVDVRMRPVAAEPGGGNP